MTLLAIVAIPTAAIAPPTVRQVMNKIHRNVGDHRDAARSRLGDSQGGQKEVRRAERTQSVGTS